MQKETITVAKVKDLVDRAIICHTKAIVNYEKMRLLLNQHSDPRLMDSRQKKEWKVKIQKIWDAIKDIQTSFYSGELKA